MTGFSSIYNFVIFEFDKHFSLSIELISFLSNFNLYNSGHCFTIISRSSPFSLLPINSSYNFILEL